MNEHTPNRARPLPGEQAANRVIAARSERSTSPLTQGLLDDACEAIAEVGRARADEGN